MLQQLFHASALPLAIVLLVPAIVALLFLGRPSQVLAIARNAFVESVRQPIYFLLIFLCGIFQIFNVWGTAYSMGYTESGEVSGDNKLLLDIGLATVFVCGMLLAAFIATAVISREIENKTVLTVVSKPISRPTIVLGKYLGVSGAMLIAIGTMSLFLLMGIRHGVLSTASDDPDQPVLLFSVVAVGLALGIGIWCNFFYGWVFTQTTTVLLFPFLLLAWTGVLVVGKEWKAQELTHDLKPQILIACGAMMVAQLVMTAVAVAASARLGQVMTIVVCAGLFVFGLLSNYLVGRHVYSNSFVARIQDAAPIRSTESSLAASGDTYQVTFEYEPRQRLIPGMPFHFGPNPNGFPLSTFDFPPVEGDITSDQVVLDRERPASLVVTATSGRTATVRHVGADGMVCSQPPQSGDSVFVRRTGVNWFARVAWGIIPNVQLFWFVDAITQHQDVPISHMGLVCLYGVAHIGIFLAVAVLLFQRREVG